MPEPQEVYIKSLAALHAATPTINVRVRVFQTLDQVGRVPMYDARRTDRKIMSSEYTKAFDEGRILPNTPYTDDGVTYVDAVLRGKIVEINTYRKGTRNLSETFSKKYKSGLVLTPIRGISLVPVSGTATGAATTGSANAASTRIVRRTRPSMDPTLPETVESRHQLHASVVGQLRIGIRNEDDGDRLHLVNVFYMCEKVLPNGRIETEEYPLKDLHFPTSVMRAIYHYSTKREASKLTYDLKLFGIPHMGNGIRTMYILHAPPEERQPSLLPLTS